ncbi:MAG TPA: DegT/DnrJ/EryC1/StrS family aminotransferase [Vicinamibacterales bacterium]|nr:DegT/DnrJ/EryC1/StrS family aminotransferase [Vicinamibacterales bacterium]
MSQPISPSGRATDVLGKIALVAADIGADEMALVSEVLRSGTLSGGPMLEQFESEMCRMLGTRFAVGVSSGTAGLHLALLSAGVTDGDLVLTSPFSFVASANVVLYERAAPIFVDIDPLTLNIDASLLGDALMDLRRGGTAARSWLPREGIATARPPVVKALLPVHVFGQSAPMRTIMAMACAHGVKVVEDACEALGARHDGQLAGTFGDAGVFGFFPNKQITTGEGGLVATNSPDCAALCRSLRNQGRDSDSRWLRYSRLGYNYRLDELSAAVGLAQLRRFDALLASRARIAAGYNDRLAGFTDLAPLRIAPGTTHMSWFVYVVRFADHVNRDGVMSALEQDGIPSRPYFPPIHLEPFYRERFGYREGDFPHAEAAGRSMLALPFHGRLTDAELDLIVDRLRAAVARNMARVPPPRAPSSGAR